jgi:hypothetical protein
MRDNHPDLNLTIDNTSGEYYLTTQSEFGHVGCKLMIKTPEQLNSIIEEVNIVLNKIAEDQKYSQEIDIDPELCNEHLKSIAQLNLFDRIFPESCECTKVIKKVLKESSKIQINAGNSFFIPWSIFYDKELKRGENVDKSSFWGFKHVIEQIPVIEKWSWQFGTKIDAEELLLSFNRNENIDVNFKVTCVQQQKEFFKGIKSATFKSMDRTKKTEVIDALSENQVQDSIIYFYCHAQNGLGRREKYIELTPPDKPDNYLSLEDLNNYAKQHNLQKEPLVFINACESARISPLFYDTFVTYFMNKGSRGMIGTVCKVPVIFSSAFAIRFFEKLLNGERIGDIMLQLRREFLEKHNNLMGLNYIALCNSELHLTSPI